MATGVGPLRRGLAKTLTLTHEAAELLRELAPNDKTHGYFISDLIEREAVRREERQRVREELAAQLLAGEHRA